MYNNVNILREEVYGHYQMCYVEIEIKNWHQYKRTCINKLYLTF